jgi:HlyD family secretion protein
MKTPTSMKRTFIAAIALLALHGCRTESTEGDASGTFEATEIIVSSEVNGKVLALDLVEGQTLTRGQAVGMIDSTTLYLNKLQLLQSQKAVLAGRQDIDAQLDGLRKELNNALADQKRIENLVKGQVASQKQLDDATLRVETLKARIKAQESQLQTANTSMNEQGRSISAQLSLINDQLRRCRINNPVEGTVLTKYCEAFEMTAVGKPLYKVADLSALVLRAYITNDQHAKVKVGQAVKVMVDSGDGAMKTYPGVVQWINDKAEFTPKTIQTKDERVNLVYAIKVSVKNDGYLKIGMYGEVGF